MDNSIISKEYYIYFLAGFLDSAKKYMISTKDYNSECIKNIKLILNYLEFVYKEVIINDIKYINIQTLNPFCKIQIL
jgi:hypothetical protein